MNILHLSHKGFPSAGSPNIRPAANAIMDATPTAGIAYYCIMGSQSILKRSRCKVNIAPLVILTCEIGNETNTPHRISNWRPQILPWRLPKHPGHR